MISRAPLLGLLIGGIAIGPAAGVEVEGNKLVLDATEMAACRNEGGCMLLTDQYLRHLLAQERAKACQRSGAMT